MGAFLALVIAGSAPAQVDLREDEDYSNSSFVRTSDEVKAELFFAEQKVEAKEWAAAVNAYQRILDRTEPAVVAFTDRVWLSAHEAARRHLERLPEEARARYRDLFEEKAAAARQQALRLFDPDRLIRVARRYPLTTAAMRALESASGLAAERGDVAMLTRVVRMLSASGAVRPIDQARLMHALADVGDRREVEALAARIEGQGDVAFGGSTLGREMEAALSRVASGADATRLTRLSGDPLVAQAIGRLPFEEKVRTPREEIDQLGYQPIAFPPVGLVTLAGRSIAAGQLGLYRIDGTLESRRPVLEYRKKFDARPESRDVSSRSLTPVADGDRLLLVLNERERSFFSAGEEVSQIVCVNARDLSIVWRVHPDAPGFDERLSGVVFEGPVVIHGALVLVTGSRMATDTSCALYAFDKSSGRLVWERFLASAMKIPQFETRNRKTQIERAEPSTVTVAEGVAYCSTNLGVVAAVDARSGEALWLFKYNRVKPSDPDTYRRISYYDTGGWLPSPLEVIGEHLIVAPEDSHFLYVLHRRPSAEGYIIGPDPMFKAGREMLVGVDRARGHLLFLEQIGVGVARARVRLVATRIDGTRVWDSIPLQIEERVTGRPAMVGDAFFVPTNKAIYRFRLDRQGSAFDSIPVPPALLRIGERYVFGNLSYEGGRLISISPILAFELKPAD